MRLLAQLCAIHTKELINSLTDHAEDQDQDGSSSSLDLRGRFGKRSNDSILRGSVFQISLR